MPIWQHDIGMIGPKRYTVTADPLPPADRTRRPLGINATSRDAWPVGNDGRA